MGGKTRMGEQSVRKKRRAASERGSQEGMSWWWCGGFYGRRPRFNNV